MPGFSDPKGKKMRDMTLDEQLSVSRPLTDGTIAALCGYANAGSIRTQRSRGKPIPRRKVLDMARRLREIADTLTTLAGHP